MNNFQYLCEILLLTSLQFTESNFGEYLECTSTRGRCRFIQSACEVTLEKIIKTMKYVI